jgi:hypothetical protein
MMRVNIKYIFDITKEFINKYLNQLQKLDEFLLKAKKK